MFDDYSRFLRARKFNLKQSKAMIKTCIERRKTVGGVGIDEIYKRLDPYDVRRTVTHSRDVRILKGNFVQVSRTKRSFQVLAHLVSQSASRFYFPHVVPYITFPGR